MIKKLLIAFFIYIILTLIPLNTTQNKFFRFIQPVYALDSLKINSINFDNSDSIIFLGTSTGADSSDIKIVKRQLSEPNRTFFDIENAVITFPNKTYSIKNSRMQQLRIAQNSTTPDVVRIVMWNSPNYDPKQIKVLRFKNNIIIKLSNEIPLQSYLTQIYRETKESAVDYYDKAVVIPEEPVITSQSDEIFKKVQKAFKEETPELVRPNIEQKQARLKSRFFIEKVKINASDITLEGIGVVNIKKPIILSEPSRIVYDFPNTIVLQDLREKEFKLGDNVTAKIGQFEPSVARIVIKTPNPDKYIPVYSTNLQSITFADKTNLSGLKTTAESTKLSYFKEQNVNASTDVINIIFSNPVVYSLKKEHNNLNVIFYNLADFNTESFNMVAIKNKTGFLAKKLSQNTYQISFPASSSVLVDCYETLNASQLRFVLTKLNSEPSATSKQEGMIPSIQIPQAKKSSSLNNEMLKRENLSESIKDKKPIKRDKKASKKESARIKKIRNKIIIIDPGHGGNDTGALRNGILEKNLTLQIALKVREILKEKGFNNVIMTRTTDKTLTLADRVEIANSNCADIYVSIHINSSVKNEINGIETHYYSDKGYDVAKVMHKELMSKVNAIDRGLFKSKFYVINHTEAPAVLLELGFISNEKERNSLTSQKRQINSAEAIAEGIIKYLTEY